MAAVFTPLSPQDIEQVALAFGIGKVLQTRAIAGGSVNTTYGLKTAQGNFFLRLEEVKSPAELRSELAYLQFVAARGFPLPLPLRVVNSTESIFELRGKQICLTPEFAGKAQAVSQFKREDFSDLGALVARLHVAGEGFPEKLPDRFRLKSLAAIFQKVRSQLDGEHRRFVTGIEAELKYQEKASEQIAALPHGIVHGDLFADNLFFEKGRLRGIIDFDAAATRELLFDLGCVLDALCFAEKDFNWEHIAAFIRGYETQRKLTALERAAMVSAWRLSTLRFVITRIADYELRDRAKAGMEYRDYRDFYRRLEIQQGLKAEEFWKKMKE